MLTGKSTATMFLVWVMLIGVAGCANQSSILIGFSGELTGKRAELGVAGRDGAQLAVDDVNQSSGVNGRPLKLLVRDDKGDPATARQVDAGLVKEGVVAIVGHITSEQTAAVYEQMNQSKVILLSPTSSASQFTRQADYFFRVMPSNELTGQSLATHIYTVRKLRQLTGIYDLGNRTFTETWWRAAQAEFERLGGRTQSLTFTSGKTDLNALMIQVKTAQPEAVVFIASAVDTALKQTRGQAADLPQALITIKALSGIQGLISMDEYGDVMRDVYIVRVEGRQFRVIQTIHPQ